MWSQINQQLFDVLNADVQAGTPVKRIVVTGHSLGAGMVQIVALAIAKKYAETYGLQVMF